MHKLFKLINKKKRLVAGLMSGTSLDGIDCVIVEIEGNGLNTKIKTIAYKNKKMDETLRNKILRASSIEESSVDLICRLNFEVGEVLAETVIETCEEFNIPLDELDLIGSHGQTIYHIPQNSTLQIGELSIIAERTGAITIGDFRVRDVAAGGHGAPLVPYSEYLIYRSKDKNIALQNIGGIGNVTVIPKNCTIDQIFAFDTGPGNMVIDYIVTELTEGKKTYDENGSMAKKGQINKHMLSELMQHPYIKKEPPKTTGREDFGVHFSKEILARYRNENVSDVDILATVTYFTAKSIVDSYKRWILPETPLDLVIVGGGGSYNNTLLKYIKKELEGISVVTQEDIGYSSDAKEAIAFAVLANETIYGNFNNIPNVTKAKHPVVMGKIVV